MTAVTDKILEEQLQFYEKYFPLENYHKKYPNLNNICETNIRVGNYTYISITRYVFFYHYFKQIGKPFILLFDFVYNYSPFKAYNEEKFPFILFKAMKISDKEHLPILIPVFTEDHAVACIIFKCVYGWNMISLDTSAFVKNNFNIFNPIIKGFEMYRQDTKDHNMDHKNRDKIQVNAVRVRTNLSAVDEQLNKSSPISSRVKVKSSDCAKNFQLFTHSCAGLSLVLSIYFIYYYNRYKKKFCSATTMRKFCHLFETVNKKHFSAQFSLYVDILFDIDQGIHALFNADQRRKTSPISIVDSISTLTDMNKVIAAGKIDIDPDFGKKLNNYNIFHALRIKHPKKFQKLMDEPERLDLKLLYEDTEPSGSEETDPESEEDILLMQTNSD